MKTDSRGSGLFQMIEEKLLKEKIKLRSFEEICNDFEVVRRVKNKRVKKSETICKNVANKKL